MPIDNQNRLSVGVVVEETSINLYEQAARNVGDVEVCLAYSQVYDTGSPLPPGRFRLIIQPGETSKDLHSFWEELSRVKSNEMPDQRT